MNFEDILLGIAIGDAFGAGVEFMDRDWIKTNVDFTTFVNARHLIETPAADAEIFTRNYNAWDYTDDTEMTIGVIHALLSGEEFSEELLLRYWTKEYQDGYKRKGYGRNGHGSMRWIYSGEKTIEEVRKFQKNTLYPGNAPVMRAVPLGFVSENRMNAYAGLNADATHPHPKARAGSILVARATQYLLVQKGNPLYLIPYCLTYISGIDTETEQLLSRLDHLPAPDYLDEGHYDILCGPQPIEPPRFLPGIKGVPSDAMLTAGCVLYILKHAKDTFIGLKMAICLGGDVDSIASVCTGVLAGMYGLHTLPEFMRFHVEGKELIHSLATQWDTCFPG